MRSIFAWIMDMFGNPHKKAMWVFDHWIFAIIGLILMIIIL